MAILTRGAVAYPGSSRDYRTGSWRDHRPVHHHLAAPCHAACPAGEDAQAYIARVQDGRPRAAWEILAAVNPLPAVTGRVCHHPCEQGCNRGTVDEPVAIHAIERYLGDQAIREGWPLPVPDGAALAGEVAVVGAGPAGLSAAYHLRRSGYRVTMFERDGEPGGLLRSAIPAYRAPRDVLAAELSRLFGIGISFSPHQALGRDIHLDELRHRFGAVFLAPGCHAARDWTVEGAATVDSPPGLDLIREWQDVGVTSAAGKRVVVHGGGNTAIDAARLLRWSGASEVHVVTASGLPDDAETPIGDRMAAFPREVAQAEEEGVTIHPHHTLTRVIVRNGHVVGVELAAVKKLPGRDDAMHRIAFEGTERVIDADLVVPAIGEVVAPGGLEPVLGGRPFIAVDEQFRIAGAPGVFAGGDALGANGTVSGAIGHGRRAANAIDRYLRGAEQAEPAVGVPIGADHLNLHYFDRSPRRDGPVTKVADRVPDREIEASLSAADFHAEAARCLSCGDCLACDNCWTFCPDSAVLKTRDIATDGSHYVFDYDYCKGCGLCAQECPTGFISMIEEMVEEPD